MTGEAKRTISSRRSAMTSPKRRARVRRTSEIPKIMRDHAICQFPYAHATATKKGRTFLEWHVAVSVPHSYRDFKSTEVQDSHTCSSLGTWSEGHARDSNRIISIGASFYPTPPPPRTRVSRAHYMSFLQELYSLINIQRSKKWLVRGLVKFATAVARLVCPDLLG